VVGPADGVGGGAAAASAVAAAAKETCVSEGVQQVVTPALSPPFRSDLVTTFFFGRYSVFDS
jgi:hypothetical protein